MIKGMILAAVVCLAVDAQTPSDSGSGQTITGLLMDATCSVISSSAKTPASRSDRMADRTERDAANNPGTNGPAGERAARASEQAISSTATAGPSQASATGTTGAAVNTAPPPRAANTKPAAGERARTESALSVREKYKDCAVKPGTTAFAIHTDRQVYILESASNRMVQEQMRNEAFRASMSDRAGADRFMTVTVMGTPSGNKLQITSVRK